VKESKCLFGMRYVEYLGHVVGCGAQAVSEYCSKALQDYSEATDKEAVMVIHIGNVLFSTFIPGFPHLSSVLTPATSKTVSRVVRWAEEMDQAYITLKSKLCNVTGLCIPTCSDVYVIYILTPQLRE